MPDPTREELVRLTDWVRQNFGISFPDVTSPSLVVRVVQFCVQQNVTVSQTVDRCIMGDRPLVQALAEALSTNYTFFFREQIVLDYFASTIIPALPWDGARIWSAACSSGEEAYTLGIMMTLAGRATSKDSFAILGTDISQRHVRAAESGIYAATAVTGSCTPEILRQFFLPAGMGMYQVAQQLRERCTFRLLNLRAAPWPFEKRFHVVFLRNVLYYFDATDALRIGRACGDTLEPGGFLVTSVTDPVLSLDAFGVKMVRPGIYRRVG